MKVRSPRIALSAFAAVCCGGTVAAAAAGGVADPCEDTLADSPSPIKDCSVLIGSYACGTELWGTNVDDVCRRTCGLCGDGGEEEGGPNAGGGDDGNVDGDGARRPSVPHVARLDPNFATLEYTDFNVTEDFVEITNIVPEDTDWFGFHFYTYASVPGDEEAAMGYTFTINHGATDPQELISHRAFWLNYFGPTSDAVADLGIDSPVWECPAHAAATTDACAYDEELGEGDFMVGAGVFTLGMRPQPPGREDVALVRAELRPDGSYEIVWRRSRHAPFDGEKMQVRYASAPREYVPPGEIPAVLGYKYHGVPNRFSDELALTPDASSTGGVGRIEDGLLQHALLPPDDAKEPNGKEVLEVGGAYGWVNPPPGAERYADVAIDAGAVLRFNYLGFHNVALLPSLGAFEACDLSEARVVGGNFDYPFDLVLEGYEVGEVLYVTSTTKTSDSSEPKQCKLGAKFKVTIIGEERDIEADKTEDSVESDGVLGAVRARAMAAITLSLAIFFC